MTSGGDFFGGTQVTFSDVLGDQQFNLYAESVSQYRTFALGYLNLSRRLQYALQGFSQTQFYYANDAGTYLRRAVWLPQPQRCAGHPDCARRHRVRDLSAQPLRADGTDRRPDALQAAVQHPSLQQVAQHYQQQVYGQSLFADGYMAPIGAAYVRETTVFREYGPLSGDTLRVGYEIAPKVGGLISRQTADLDARKYIRLATNGTLAFRFRGLKSWGDFPSYLYYGGNSEVRGYDYLEFIGNKAFFADAELRFPLIEAALTPVGVIGGLRAVAFFDLGASQSANNPLTVFSNKTTIQTPITSYSTDPFTGVSTPVFGQPSQITGFHLVDGRASYGLGLETFALGFPIHFDWSWRTMFNKGWEDYIYSYQAAADNVSSGSTWLRRPKFSVWIGYDF